MIFAGILAGGSGKRMKFTDLPKQFLDLDGKPVIVHTLEKFLLIEEINSIYVGMNPEWINYFEDIIEKYLKEYKQNIIIVKGGKNRNSTIENILNKINDDYDIRDDDIIITHDAVRPFINLKIITENIEMARYNLMVDTVIPAVDTIVESIDGKKLSNIPYRNYMYQGQTPQTFNIKAYKKLYSKLSNEQKETLTDACKVFMLNNEDIAIVKGEINNIKLTTVSDLKLAEALLEDFK